MTQQFAILPFEDLALIKSELAAIRARLDAVDVNPKPQWGGPGATSQK